eukprot:g28753.t1
MGTVSGQSSGRVVQSHHQSIDVQEDRIGKITQKPLSLLSVVPIIPELVRVHWAPSTTLSSGRAQADCRVHAPTVFSTSARPGGTQTNAEKKGKLNRYILG